MSTNVIPIKQLKDALPKQVDAALDQHAMLAEGLATRVRYLFALLFILSAVWTWNHHSTARYLYLAFAGIWIVFALVVSRLMKSGTSDAVVSRTTFIDTTIVHLAILAFVQQGLFPKIGPGIFLCYFPVLAVAANRYRIGLVLATAIYAAAGYLAVSLYSGNSPWFRIAVLAVTTFVLIAGSRKPKTLVVDVATTAMQNAFDSGFKNSEQEMSARIHQILMSPPIVDLPEIWSSSKHGVGSVTSGDCYQIFETDQGPIFVIGDLTGNGLDAVTDVARLNQALTRITGRTAGLSAIAQELNKYLWETYQGKKSFTCILARWHGEEIDYLNAGHLPAIQVGKQERKQLPATCGPLGLKQQDEFKMEVLPFPHRDLLVAFTDGLYARLTADREKGIAEIESFINKFSGAEITTLCHRIFDCAHPGFEQNKDDSTVVVIRRQPGA